MSANILEDWVQAGASASVALYRVRKCQFFSCACQDFLSFFTLSCCIYSYSYSMKLISIIT